MSTNEEIAAQIVEIVRQAPGQKILGTQLAVDLRRAAGFDPNVHGRLKNFISTNVPSVQRIGPSGGDSFYGMAGDGNGEPETTEGPVIPASPVDPETLSRTLDGSIWKVYASPGSMFHLVGNPKTGELRVIAPGLPTPETPWVAIPSCPVSVHTEIAKAFLAQLQDGEKRAALEEIVDKSGSGPESGFYQKVAAFRLVPEWIQFRRKKIIAQLAAALQDAGIAYHGSVAKFRSTIRTPPVKHYEARSEPVTPQVIDIRYIALAAVQKMSVAELRTLSIPLGYILDIISNRPA